MIGHLLTLFTALATFGVGAIALQILARRVGSAVRVVEPVRASRSDYDLR